MNNPSIVILVIATNGGIYDNFKKTWLKMQERAERKNINVNIYFTYGNPSNSPQTCTLNGKHDLVCNVKDTPLKGVLIKTVYGIEYCLDNLDFDYLILSNLSTIIIPDRLSKYLESKPLTKYFSGHIWYVGKTTETYSNWCVWTVSKDIVEYIVKNKIDFLNYPPTPADVSSSRLIQRQYDITESLTNHGMYYNNSVLNNPMKNNNAEIADNNNCKIYCKIFHAKLMNIDCFVNDDDFFWIRVRNKDRNLDIQLHEKIRELF